MILKKKRESPEDFVGWKSPDGKLEVVGIADETGKNGRKLFKVTCTECSKDKELFPDGYFVSYKDDLKRNKKPCGCSKKPEWFDWQYLILTRRVGEDKGFIVHGFAEEFHRQSTKLKLECLKDGYKWVTAIKEIINKGTGCPKCANRPKVDEQNALQKCTNICKELNYHVAGFPDGYLNAKSRFEYVCPKHGRQNISYNDFVHGGKRCGGCAVDERIRKVREDGNGNGYYPERKDEVDFLYILNFNDKFIKVGRSFDVGERLKGLRTVSKISIKNIHKLRIFTATHQEIYDLEQELHSNLRERNFQYYVDWSTECFENDCQFVLNKLLDNCGLTEVEINRG